MNALDQLGTGKGKMRKMSSGSESGGVKGAEPITTSIEFGRIVSYANDLLFYQRVAFSSFHLAFSYAVVSPTQVLISDELGRLTLITLNLSPSSQVTSIATLNLGQTSPAKSLTYIPSSHLFVGSHYGSNQLIRLLQQPEKGMEVDGEEEEKESWVREVEVWEGLAPIVDFWIGGRDNVRQITRRD